MKAFSRVPKGSAPPRASRRAFTLVEVLLALALTVVLALAVSTALTNYARLSTSGQSSVQRAQIARALLQKIETDLRSVVYQPPEPVAVDDSTGQAADQSATGNTGTETAATAEDLTVDAQTAYTASQGGVFGHATMLVIHVSRPERDQSYSTLDFTTLGMGQSSDLRTAIWFLAEANAGGLEGAVGNLASGGSVLMSRESGVQGIARLEGDRLSIGVANAEDNLQALAAGAELLAEEIAVLQFRYFDGAVWQPAWDSAVLGRLPQAVEIVLGFRADIKANETSREAAIRKLGEEEITQTYRLVVPLSLGQPNPETIAY